MWAPQGRNAELAIQLLSRYGNRAVECASPEDIAAGLGNAGCALITQDALTRERLLVLEEAIRAQPSWSDFPFILLAPKPEPGRTQSPAWRVLGNVTVLERPTQSRTLLSAVDAALRARRRQYEMREAMQRRDQFLAMLGHELRNPLAAIALATETDQTPKDSPNRRQKDIIARQTRHLSRLVDDLLDVARVTTGKVVLNKTTVDLNEVLQRCVQGTELNARAASIELALSVAEGPLFVHGDVVRLDEIVSNLLSNAIKYSPPQSRVEVSTRVEGEQAVVEVKDVGIGISAAMLPRVFDLFAQAEVSLDRTQGGLGIGLTIVKSLVELHGGRVAAHSDGVGSRFSVVLPLMSAAAPSSAPKSNRPPELPQCLPVLVVDDNADLLEMTKEVLEGFGCQVETANDGPSGLQRMNSFKPALAFIDIGLPGLDGYSLATEVRAVQTTRPWLVALTGYGQPEDRQRALAAGFDRHLTKPVSIAALRQAVEDANGALREG